uniref:Uncharacterized protein n=1 Tax=Eutreptiella gymnastica TaxID=73025 RepID=A0A7S4FXK8_9EUGL
MDLYGDLCLPHPLATALSAELGTRWIGLRPLSPPRKGPNDMAQWGPRVSGWNRSATVKCQNRRRLRLKGGCPKSDRRQIGDPVCPCSARMSFVLLADALCTVHVLLQSERG